MPHPNVLYTMPFLIASARSTIIFVPQFTIMARESYSALQLTCTVVVILLVCRYSSAQGCSPAPPSTLISSGPSGALLSNNIPYIITSGSSTFFRTAVGGHGTDPWSVFSETQVRQHGLWCQVKESQTMNMVNNNIGDWYYPTPSGLLALDNINNDGTPYQELKCDNQVGLVVDGDIMNNQGIVRCSTTITGLTSSTGVSIDSNYFGVYKDSVIAAIRNCEWYSFMNTPCMCTFITNFCILEIH